MTDINKKHTHTALAFKQIGGRRKIIRTLEVGTGRIDAEGIAHVFLDRLPLGGFTGYVQLIPNGTAPDLVAAEPQRPGEDEDAEASDD